MHFNARVSLSALVPQCLRVFYNGLLRFTRNDAAIQPFNYSTLQRVKAPAFTLAETLIVIGIIGVVAALTLPNLNHATGDKEKVTKVKKIYSALTDAVDRAQVIYGGMDTWFKDLSTYEERNERLAKRITEFMKVSKDCGFDEGCFSSAPLLCFDGEIYADNYVSSIQEQSAYMVTLADGISIKFGGGGDSNIKIGVDIDGPNKGKNQMGNDIFDFTVCVDNDVAVNFNMPLNQLIPSAEPETWTGKYNKEGIDANSYATAWVIQNGNLDYLKCIDDLDWETQTSCK